jgi:hypothetical protein
MQCHVIGEDGKGVSSPECTRQMLSEGSFRDWSCVHEAKLYYASCRSVKSNNNVGQKLCKPRLLPSRGRR